MKLEELLNWNSLTEEEKKRLKKIHGIREDEDYNVSGEASTTQEELDKPFVELPDDK